MGGSRRLYHAVHAGVPVGDQPKPRCVQIVERPGVLERGSSRSTTDRRRVVSIAVEGRVQLDQVYRIAVQPAQDVQVVAGPDRARREVAFRLPGLHAQDATMGNDAPSSLHSSSRAGAGISEFQNDTLPGLWQANRAMLDFDLFAKHGIRLSKEVE